MTLPEALNEIRAIHEQLCPVVASGETYWYSTLSDYKSNYSFSQDYDKSYKKTLHEKAELSRWQGEEFRAMALPTEKQEIAPFIETVIAWVGGIPGRDPSEEKIAERLSRLQEIQTWAETT